MNILHINTLDQKGGAAKVASDLSLKFNLIGHNSVMAVGQKGNYDSKSFNIKNNDFLSRISIKLTGKDVPYFFRNKIRIILSNDINFFNNILQT